MDLSENMVAIHENPKLVSSAPVMFSLQAHVSFFSIWSVPTDHPVEDSPKPFSDCKTTDQRESRWAQLRFWSVAFRSPKKRAQICFKWGEKRTQLAESLGLPHQILSLSVGQKTSGHDQSISPPQQGLLPNGWTPRYLLITLPCECVHPDSSAADLVKRRTYAVYFRCHIPGLIPLPQIPELGKRLLENRQCMNSARTWI